MTKMKMLSALIVLSAAVATASVGSGSRQAGPGSLYGLDSQSSPHGAYNQSSGPSYAATPARDRWYPANPAAIERDPSRTGGEDTTLRPSSS